MKKLVMATAVFVSFTLFGMGKPARIACNEYMTEWSKEFSKPFQEQSKDLTLFSISPLKEALREEFNGDQTALTCFNFFDAHNFTGFQEFWEANNSHMLPENAAKFREVLLLIANVIDLYFGNDEYIRRLVILAGGIKSLLTHIPSLENVQFCFEMIFCLIMETENSEERAESMIFMTCKRLCERLTDHQDYVGYWQQMEENIIFLGSTDYTEDEIECIDKPENGEEYTMLCDVGTNPTEEEVTELSMRLFGDTSH
jgi:hypothetical protein